MVVASLKQGVCGSFLFTQILIVWRKDIGTDFFNASCSLYCNDLYAEASMAGKKLHSF